MHKFYEFACRELKELESKMDKGLSAAEIEYANKLIEMKKNILKTEMLEDEGYSADEIGMPGWSYRGESRRNYSRDGRRSSRYSRDGYSRDAEDIIEQLEDIKEVTADEPTRREISRLIRKMRDV